MNALTMNNAMADTRAVVLNANGIVRPVAMVDASGSHQCICEGDVIIYKNTARTYKYRLHGLSKKIRAADVVVTPNLMGEIKDYLDSDSIELPAGMGWNGTDTIQSLAVRLGLDLFLTQADSTAVLGGLMGLDTSLLKPKVGYFDVSNLFSRGKPTLRNAAKSAQLDRLIEPLETTYKEWLLKSGICAPNSSQSWRYAKQLPEVLSVSCIVDNNGNPVRFNDLVVWRELDEEPEIISVFDMVTTFKMETNFITLPYVVDEDVKRIMYVLHDDNLSDDGDNVVWLYKKR